MKIIAFYLPQFHRIQENDTWWGEGFTEWVNVKKATPLFKNHKQPRIPLNENYYDLSEPAVMDWQISLANKYGIYGFCFYHYWFNGHLLLQKPVEDFLNDKTKNIHFCLSWANEHWTNAWVSSESKVLMHQTYGDKESWVKHFNYLFDFFQDERYIKEDNRPIFIIYRPELIDSLEEMLNTWQELAIQNGFDGIKFVYQHISYHLYNKKKEELFDYSIEYQPTYAQVLHRRGSYEKLRMFKRKISLLLEKKFGIDVRHYGNKLTHFDYDVIWNYILNATPSSSKSIPGAFVNWDNTPRRNQRGIVYDGFSIDKFQHYLSKQIKNTKEKYKTDKLFIFAWNEWAEGGYLEPDNEYDYGVLEAIRSALIENDEFPIVDESDHETK
ncbi:MAG: glycoside hydrolase family 99-like domain-containing protein [Acholeplasma sp.]|nr:glycoside hydrolase family 99-like domain-containing protein [Acholeplasma sp.]